MMKRLTLFNLKLIIKNKIQRKLKNKFKNLKRAKL